LQPSSSTALRHLLLLPFISAVLAARPILTMLFTILFSLYFLTLPDIPLTPAYFTGKSLRILPLGGRHPVSALAVREANPELASMTLGYGSTDFNGYRAHLLEFLRDHLNTVSMVGTLHNGTGKCPDDSHQGHSGYQIDAIEGVLDSTDVLARFKPNVVLILLGTNDMIFNTDEQVAQAPTRMGQLLDRIYAQCPACVILLSSIPMNAEPTTNARVDVYNAGLLALAQRRRASRQHLVHVDAHSAVALSDLNADGIHPKDAAYERIARRWYDGLSNANQHGWFAEPSANGEVIKCPVAFSA
jgi:lysophospholipase L1-like esterase